MRLVYLDEAGIGNAAHEPYIVVAGPVVNPDDSAFEIENHLRGIASRYVADPDEADSLIFHASDIWHGSRFFDRSKWSRHTRFRILRDLANIPSVFNLPIVWSFVSRSHFEEVATRHTPKDARSRAPVLGQATAFVGAAMQAEAWMKDNARSERAMIIAENTEQARSAIKMVHSGYRYRPNEDEGEQPVGRFVSKYIVENVLFAEKGESAILQVADVAAFFIRRHLTGKVDSDTYFNLIKPQLSLAENQPQEIRVRLPPERITAANDPLDRSGGESS